MVKLGVVSETNGKRKFGKKAECLNDDRVLGRRNKVKTKMGQRYEEKVKAVSQSVDIQE
ncbi:predicted protein [Sclerotinia sclerotiorum 1980 UF-70]|uniref:Uncharacterized protein n=1 Tax=Sclerotinia sclerotiorum (strain ATCC 18683 / 1980 / Ss-1) TaxID=665079 RepID=A7F1S6_SCLS1|nr:predicted protein [Sclerotinia sclerotiorum 1980 UF-70]EDN95668.1 predicted protein [Sclerotinia sclerotiorum 1980 UF-70]